MPLGDRLRRERLRKGWGVRELARLSGVRYALISELETGKKDDTTGRNLKRLARVLGVSVDYLLGTFEDNEQGDDEPAGVALVGRCSAGGTTVKRLTSLTVAAQVGTGEKDVRDDEGDHGQTP